MKKRYLGLLTMVMVFALALFGCGSNAAEEGKKAFTGLWELESIDSTDEDVSSGSDLIQYMGGYLTLNEDGSATLEMLGMEVSGTWTATDASTASVTFEDSSEEGVSGSDEIKLNDGKLSMSSSDGTIYFVQIDPSEKKESDLAAAFESAMSSALSGVSDDASSTSSTASADMLSDVQELDITVADTDGYTIKVTAKGDYFGDPSYVIEVTNKGEKTILVDDNDEFNIAGTVASPVFAMEVAAGTTVDDFLWFTNDEIGGGGVAALEGVTGQIIVSDPETGDVLGTYDFAA